MRLFDLTGRVAVVTGGNGGIGLGIAEALAEAGADVVVAARDAAKSARAVARIAAHGRRAVALPLDVADARSCAALPSAVVGTLGGCDILVANAGVNVRRRPEALDPGDWERVLGTNLTGAFRVATALHPLLRAGGRGKVLCVGSMYSLFGAPLVAPYAASKAGLVGLARSLATAWAEDGIQVNTVLPGWIETDLTARARADLPELDANVRARTPAGRWGVPADLGGAAVFFASPASDFVTGAVLAVDGGWSARG